MGRCAAARGTRPGWSECLDGLLATGAASGQGRTGAGAGACARTPAQAALGVGAAQARAGGRSVLSPAPGTRPRAGCCSLHRPPRCTCNGARGVAPPPHPHPPSGECPHPPRGSTTLAASWIKSCTRMPAHPVARCLLSHHHRCLSPAPFPPLLSPARLATPALLSRVASATPLRALPVRPYGFCAPAPCPSPSAWCAQPPHRPRVRHHP